MDSELHTRVTRLSLEDEVGLLTGRTAWVLHESPEIGLLPDTGPMERVGRFFASEARRKDVDEVHLPPFEAVLDAGAWMVTAAYNGVDDGFEAATMTGYHGLVTGLLKG